jgi:hypothetical protein
MRLTPFLFNIVLEFLAKAISQQEEIKGIKVGKEEVKLSLFSDNMFLYLKDWKNSTKTLLNTVNSFGNVAGHKINLRKSVTFLYTNNVQIKKEYRKTIPFTIVLKKIKYLGLNLTKDVKDLYRKTTNH